MLRGVSFPLAGLLVCAVLLGGCRFEGETVDPWRVEAEEKCLSEGRVVASAFIEPIPAIRGQGKCGIIHPLKVSALGEGNVALEPAGRLACPVLSQVETWVSGTVQPAAAAWFGQPVVAMRQMSSYSCRGMNGDPNAKISEHAFGNALDIGAFKLADGRWITVKDGWKGKADERGFLLQVHAGACEEFRTVLAPGSNIYHYDHIHVDLMRHQSGRSICKPAPVPVPGGIFKAPPTVYKAPPMAALPPEVAPTPLPPPLPPPAPAVARVQSQPAIYREPLPPPPSAGPPVAIQRQPLPPPAAGQRAAPLPPGWQVGPESVSPPAPMSYAPEETGSSGRRYYLSPVPQNPTIPLPRAKPGAD